MTKLPDAKKKYVGIDTKSKLFCDNNLKKFNKFYRPVARYGVSE